jgi:chemotaxis protein methyltransferase CheR
MLLADFPELAAWDTRIIATDLSDTMLERLRTGRYSQAEVERGLSPQQRARWFVEGPAGTWTARPALRDRIRAQKNNLVGAWVHLPRMDLILIRNVLIYFDEQTKREILRRARDMLRPGGYLLLGTSESLPQDETGMEQVRFGRTICYRRT